MDHSPLEILYTWSPQLMQISNFLYISNFKELHCNSHSKLIIYLYWLGGLCINTTGGMNNFTFTTYDVNFNIKVKYRIFYPFQITIFPSVLKYWKKKWIILVVGKQDVYINYFTNVPGRVNLAHLRFFWDLEMSKAFKIILGKRKKKSLFFIMLFGY